MASQTNGRSTEQRQGATRVIVNRLERQSTSSSMLPPNTHASADDWAHVQRVKEQLVTASKVFSDGQNFLFHAVQVGLNNSRDYHQAYKSMESKFKALETAHGSLVNQMHSLVAKNIALQGDVENSEGVAEAANRRAEELEAFCANLSETNMSLQQDLDLAREAIRVLKKGIMELEPSSGVATGSNTTGIHESELVVQKSPGARIMELKQPKDRDNGLDTQEADTIIVSKRASPSPGDGGLQKAEESQPNAERGRRKRDRRGRQRKPTSADRAL